MLDISRRPTRLYMPMSLHFGLWPADDVRAMAVVHVTEPKISIAARRDTVFDERMGPIGYLEKCATCNSYVADCVGHFGYIELVQPVYHPLLVDYVWKVVKNSCWQCRRQRPCACACAQGTWKRKQRSSPMVVWHVLRQNQLYLRPDEVYALLENAGKTGLMLTAMPVAPPVIRPSRRRGVAWSHDALSHAYASVVRENNVLRQFRRAHHAPHVLAAQVARLQEQIDHVYLPTTGDRPTAGFRGRLDGKQGRFRQSE